MLKYHILKYILLNITVFFYFIFFYQIMYLYEATEVWVNHEYHLTPELNFKKPLYEHEYGCYLAVGTI